MSLTEKTGPDVSPDEQRRLWELTNQSWNLELVISGAALFTVLQLPGLLDDAFDYIQYNLLTKSTGTNRMLPSLAYSVIKVSCCVLFLAFLANFIMRAFWVGLVGLLAAYPGGIRYNRIPFASALSQERMEREMGAVERYILALDRRCNIVFAVAFLFVLILIIIALLYLLILAIHAGLRPILPAALWQATKVVLIGFFAIYTVGSLLLSMPQLKEKPALTRYHYWLGSLNKLIFMGFYRPVNFILNTFYSNIPPRKVIRNIVVMTVVFFVFLFIQLYFDSSRMEGRGLIVGQRHLFTTQKNNVLVQPSVYDDQRGADDPVPVASIQSDVIKDPFIRVFIAYPKALDTLLLGYGPAPEWPGKLPRAERQKLQAAWATQKFNEAVRISVNDSLYAAPGMQFALHGPSEQIGWQTVLLAANLKPGPNQLRIALANARTKEESALLTIPFWYAPE